MSAPRGLFRNKRWRIVAVVAGVLLVGGLGIYFTAPREPKYQGKKLSWWIVQSVWNWRVKGSPEATSTSARAEQAIKAIGTNAIPTLLKWMQTQDSPFRDKVNSLLEKQRIISFRFEDPETKWSLAYAGFEALGTNAMPAVPALSSLMESPQQQIALLSILAIADDGKKVVMLPVIVQSLQRKDILHSIAGSYIELKYPEQAKALGINKNASKLTYPMDPTNL